MITEGSLKSIFRQYAHMKSRGEKSQEAEKKRKEKTKKNSKKKEDTGYRCAKRQGSHESL